MEGEGRGWGIQQKWGKQSRERVVVRGGKHQAPIRRALMWREGGESRANVQRSLSEGPDAAVSDLRNAASPLFLFLSLFSFLIIQPTQATRAHAGGCVGIAKSEV